MDARVAATEPAAALLLAALVQAAALLLATSRTLGGEPGVDGSNGPGIVRPAAENGRSGLRKGAVCGLGRLSAKGVAWWPESERGVTGLLPVCGVTGLVPVEYEAGRRASGVEAGALILMLL